MHPAGENCDNYSQLKKVGFLVVSSAGEILMLTHLNAVVRSRARDVHLLYKGSGVGLFQDDFHVEENKSACRQHKKH